MDWQVHVYGRAQAELAEWCAARGVALHVFEWSLAHAAAGLARDAIYLLRPDTYVALAGTTGTGAALEVYFKDIEVCIAAP
jgi:hypothetical protein